MNKETLFKYLNNTCSNEEFEDLIRWVKLGKDKEDKNWSYDYWKHFSSELNEKDEGKYSLLLDKIHHQINLRQSKDRENKVISLSQITKWISRVAAILFLPLLGVILYFLSTNNFQIDKFTDLTIDSLEVIAPVGSRTIVQLADGTEVNLNYGSKIKYPRNFVGGTREITLSGEGYFDVTHNPDKPFIVKTGKLNIKAVGTKFNVLAYPGEDIIETTLVEGKVIIEKSIQRDKNKQIGTMVPGQHVSYNVNSGRITSSEGNTDKYIAWKDGKLVFDNTPITEIAKTLSRMFNVEIEVSDDVKDLSYTVTFFNDPLYLILDLMTETTPITYKTLPRKRQSDGTFSKQKIIIEKRQ